jgi:rod shape-determining protein MreC
MSDSRDDFIIAVRYALLKKGAKQKFSLSFLILFSIGIILLDKFSIPPVKIVKGVITDIVYRAAVIASIPGKVVMYLGSETKKHIGTYNENIALQEEIRILKKKQLDIDFLKTENKNLKLILGLEKIEIHEEDITIVAKVMVDQISPFLKSVIINKGTNHEIVKGMTVFSKNYLIGTVIETNYLSSRVLLITDLNSKIPAVIQDTDVNVILAGNGNKNNFTLEYLPEEFTLEPNKIIFTSGKDGFLKAGMPIAETYLNKKNELKIKSLADPQQASIIHVSRGQFKN